MRLRPTTGRLLSRSDYGACLILWRICPRARAGAVCCTPFISDSLSICARLCEDFAATIGFALDRLAPSEENTQMVEAGSCAIAGVYSHAVGRFPAGSNGPGPRFSYPAIGKLLGAQRRCACIFGHSFSQP